jgi:hypothetical protein
MPTTAVHLIRAFDGPLHERCERAWRRFHAVNRDNFDLIIHENRHQRVDHPEMLNLLWYEHHADPYRYLVFSELDFLPHPTKFLRPLSRLNATTPVSAAESVTRDAETQQLVRHGKTAPWYMSFLKSACPRSLNFIGHPDTANDIGLQVKADLLPCDDGRPAHYGVTLPTGVHAFFSRHWGDDRTLRVAGLPLCDIMRGVESLISKYEELQNLTLPEDAT